MNVKELKTKDDVIESIKHMSVSELLNFDTLWEAEKSQIDHIKIV